ncbi:MAG TPA: AI-2E family transporter, partial [Oceanospirillales bacterium]|nr:AI-2E family transporter [Oceanospirillales bacterium]
KRNFNNPQVVILISILIIVFAVVIFLGKPLSPFLSSIVLAYLLESVIIRLQKLKVPRIVSVTVVFLLFVTFLMFLIFWVIPILIAQVSELVQQLPTYLSTGLEFVRKLPDNYPTVISKEQAASLTSTITSELTQLGQGVLSKTVSSVFSVISIGIFIVLTPILVFFMLKDKSQILNWFSRFIPRDSKLTLAIWGEVDVQIGNYVRGKVIEIFIVGLVTYILFVLFDLKYSILLATLTGFSVLIPYIGAALVTIPIALVAFFQFNWSPDFAWIMISYSVIQLLDGNVLVPWLFSEVNNLHPVAIIVAVLFFGGIWGFWGVFFAIPLATMVNAIINAWPKRLDID